ncbi:methyl-accepting chemotaxis protein, partial [Brevundimonas sp.]|uniref:HAMP domain-containing protein n=1 Tax=Brevundimonas sp. TaxID=1871086 RepID=UPI00260FE9B6
MLSTIRSKVKFAGYAVLALCGLSSGVGLVVALMLSASLADSTRTSQIMRNHLEGDMMHDALNSDVLAALLAAEQGRVSEIGGIRTDLEEHAAHFRAMIAENKAIATDPGTIEVLTAVEQPLEQYIAAAEAIVALAATDPVGANAALPAFSTRFSELEDRNGAASEAIEATLTDTKARADFLVVGGDILIGLTVLLAIGLTLLLNRQAVRTVVEPIGVLNDEMTALSAGDTTVELTSAGRQDEIGKVGRSVVDLQALIIERARAEAQAQATQRSVAEQAQLAVAEQQAEVVTAMAEGLDHLMRGDLSHRIERRFPEGYEKLKADFNAAMAQLQETLLSVDGNASVIRSGAHEMTQATDDLSRRTEQQAASLEETAAALDEITATVNRTASGARQASETVQAA